MNHRTTMGLLVVQRLAALPNAIGGLLVATVIGARRRARNAPEFFAVGATLRQRIAGFLLALIVSAAVCVGQTNNTMGQGRAPKEVSEWMKLFDSSALYKHDSGRLFEDFCEVCICCFANQTMEARYLEIVKRYDRQELDTMAQLMAMLIVIHEDHTADGGWFDALGLIYEHMASRHKSSRLGQFFTPPELCNVMARILYDGVDGAAPEAYDPCCGSGRLLLAQKAVRKDIELCVAGDIDPVCVKMCALNFWLHGIRGEVACMDSLGLKWHFAYQTHPRLLWPFITYIGEDRKTESLMYMDAQHILDRANAVAKPAFSPDLFNQVSEPVAGYGTDEDLDEEPFRPCDLCGRVKSDVCHVINGEPHEIWSVEEQRMLCPGCHVPMWNERVVSELQTA